MQKMAEAGQISTIVVKDLSRFGRNYLEVGKYLEIQYPTLGIRFIAIQENVDTFNNTGIANRLYFLSLSDGMSKVENYAGLSKEPNDQSTLGLKITTMKTRMQSFKTMMDKYQDAMYKKYDNLEVLIQKMSVQLSMVTGGNG